jgi:hypothetical protein
MGAVQLRLLSSNGFGQGNLNLMQLCLVHPATHETESACSALPRNQTVGWLTLRMVLVLIWGSRSENYKSAKLIADAGLPVIQRRRGQRTTAKNYCELLRRLKSYAGPQGTWKCYNVGIGTYRMQCDFCSNVGFLGVRTYEYRPLTLL